MFFMNSLLAMLMVTILILILTFCSPLQENKQSPLLSIEEIQNGIQSQDGHKQLQVG